MSRKLYSKRAAANALSIGRGIAAPFVAKEFRRTPLSERTWGFAGGVALISVTDILDGPLSRQDDKTKSSVGSWLDNIADKVLVLSSLKALAMNGEISKAQFRLNLCRDLAVTALRIYGEGQGLDTSAHNTGKLKTWVGMGALVVAASPVAEGHPKLVRNLVTASTVLSLISGAEMAVSMLDDAASLRAVSNYETPIYDQV